LSLFDSKNQKLIFNLKFDLSKILPKMFWECLVVEKMSMMFILNKLEEFRKKVVLNFSNLFSRKFRF